MGGCVLYLFFMGVLGFLFGHFVYDEGAEWATFNVIGGMFILVIGGLFHMAWKAVEDVLEMR